MSIFKDLMTDRVTLVKKDGRRFENLSASVQSGKILTDNPKIPIEDGDEFERRLPSGIPEVFTVLDAGFQQGMPGMPSHYQSAVRKSTAVTPAAPQPHVVYNLVGANSRVNIQSSDSSTNVVNVESSVLFTNLRQAIQHSSLDSTVAQQLIESVNGMQSSAGTKTFGQRYKEFIGVAADHMTLIGPFLPALSQLLT
jgi:hypothetical protein